MEDPQMTSIWIFASCRPRMTPMWDKPRADPLPRARPILGGLIMGYPLSDRRVFGIRKKETDFRMKRRSSKTGDPMLKSKMQDSRSKLFYQCEICYVLNENYDNIQEKLFKIIDLSGFECLNGNPSHLHPLTGRLAYPSFRF
jgi:hypothetical protein